MIKDRVAIRENEADLIDIITRDVFLCEDQLQLFRFVADALAK